MSGYWNVITKVAQQPAVKKAISKVVDYAVKKGLDGLVIFVKGPEAEAMQGAANSLKYVEVVSSPEEAFFILKNWLKSGDFLLLKASRQVSLERLLPLLKDYY